MAEKSRMPIPYGVRIIRDRSERYTVWQDGPWLYKQQPKYLTDNEFIFLSAMRRANGLYVPRALERLDIETIRMEFIDNEPVTNQEEFMSHYPFVIDTLQEAGIRHGDLTIYAVLVNENRPILIDFSESRWFNDPMPSKRRQPDTTMLLETMSELCNR